MQIRNHYLKKNQVKLITEDYPILQARQHLQETGYRCVPILDSSKRKFLGNVYEIDTYKYNGSLEDSVLSIADNKNCTVHQDDSFFRVFFTIRKLPYLAVLNEDDEFIGILTHSSVMDVAEDAFGVHTKGHSITVGAFDFDDTLKELTRILSKHSSIQSLITLNSNNFVRQIVFSLPKSIDESKLTAIRKELEAANFNIVHEDQLH